jgi:Flp pilus assembly protein TadB
MDEDEVKRLWSNIATERIEINNDILIESLDDKLKKIERKVRRRDRREIFVCICLIPLFGWWVITVPPMLSKIGALIVVLACLLVVFKLVYARRVTVTEDIASEIGHRVTVSLQLLKQQITLLQTVLWWYLLPFFVGIILFYFGLVTSVLSKAIYSLIVAVAYGYIYYLNKRAVRNHLKPLEEQLTNILNDLYYSESNSLGSMNSHR